MKKIYKTPFAIAMGASLLPMASNIAVAESNPFALSEMSAAYMQTAEAKPEQAGADKMKAGSCGEGKCGAAMMNNAAKADKKVNEGKCAAKKSTADASKPADAKTDSAK